MIGVHGAGWNFYDGVWDVLYDLMGLKWHTEEDPWETEYESAGAEDDVMLES